MGFMSELDNLGLPELIDLFQAPYPKSDEYAPLYYDEIAFRILWKGEEGRAFLLSELEKADTVRLEAILDALPSTEHPLPRNLLLSYLEDKRPTVVLNAIDGLASQEQRDAVEEVLALYHHPDQYVRGAVLRYMSRLFPEKALPILIEALQDPDFIVRESAVDELDDLQAVETLAHVRPLLQDAHPDVREAAETAVEHFEEILSETQTARP